MNNDLISREALKKAIEKLIGYSLSYEAILNAIDNAPTVEPFEPDYVGAERCEARQRGYEQGYHEGMKIGKTLNPKIKQGEWITDNLRNTICNRCGGIRRDNRVDYIAFCNKCGAEMRKGGAENDCI